MDWGSRWSFFSFVSGLGGGGGGGGGGLKLLIIMRSNEFLLWCVN